MKKHEKLALVRSYYPNALTTTDMIERMIGYVEETLNLEPSQVVMADSICSDDVNSIQSPIRAREFLGPFKLGGLDGFPFTGLTGMGAFASHVPDDGAVFIYYGPHIGVSKAGVLGEIHRFGQSKNSGSCGAAKAALSKLQANNLAEAQPSNLDYQMNTIEQIMLRQKDRILQASQPLHEATEVMYEAIDQRIQELVEQTTFKCPYVLLMGAVLINGDSDMGSCSAAKRFEQIDVSTGQRTDLMQYIAV